MRADADFVEPGSTEGEEALHLGGEVEVMRSR
jgi:hypothetical protein